MTFAVLVNLAMVASFIWPELVSPSFRLFVWTAAVVVWAAWVVGRACRLRFAVTQSAVGGDPNALFQQAQHESLLGDWGGAEATLRRLLRCWPRDVDARLMLATVLRHAGRPDAARRQLRRLRQLEAAEKWQLEIQQEYERLAREFSGDVEMEAGDLRSANGGSDEEHPVRDAA
jgi:hypothetical protein